MCAALIAPAALPALWQGARGQCCQDMWARPARGRGQHGDPGLRPSWAGEAGAEGTARQSGGRQGCAVLGRSTGVAGAGSSRAPAMLRSREPRPRPCAAPGLSTSGCPGLGTQPGHCQQPPQGHSPLSRASPALPHARSGCHWMSPLCCASPRQPRACPHGHPHPGVAARTRVCTCTCTAPSQPLQPWPPVLGDFSTRGGGRKTHPEQTWQRERALGTHPLPAATPPLTFAQAPSEAAVGEGIKWEAGAAPVEQSPSAARPGEWGSPRQASGPGQAPGTGERGWGRVPRPPPHATCSALSPAMKVSVLLLLVCVAVLAVGARKGDGRKGEDGARGARGAGVRTHRSHGACACRGRHAR